MGPGGEAQPHCCVLCFVYLSEKSVLGVETGERERGEREVEQTRGERGGLRARSWEGRRRVGVDAGGGSVTAGGYLVARVAFSSAEGWSWEVCSGGLGGASSLSPGARNRRMGVGVAQEDTCTGSRESLVRTRKPALPGPQVSRRTFEPRCSFSKGGNDKAPSRGRADLTESA